MREAAPAIGLVSMLVGACLAPGLASSALAQPIAARAPAQLAAASTREVAAVRVVAVPATAAVSAPAGAELTLRPAPGLQPLAAKVARVLSLRFAARGSRVVVGGAPPPGLLEAVPAGHLALAREDGRMRLVLGGPLGAWYEASVPISGSGEADVRALALAAEALRDLSLETRERAADDDPSAVVEAALAATDRDAAQPTAADEVAPNPYGDAAPPSPSGSERAIARPTVAAPPRDSAQPAFSRPDPDKQREVEPMFFVRTYGGASSSSDDLHMGIATGGGLCVQGHCLVLAIESPLPFLPEADAEDVRYRYPTITSGFYSRPWQFGRFAPAASIGFLSRIGHFRRDMGAQGADEDGLDTDLGVRGALEGSLVIIGSFEATAELGLDYALDRWRLGIGDTVAYRGDRAAVWAQAGLRIRPY